MKLKIRFPGMLLPYQKAHQYPNNSTVKEPNHDPAALPHPNAGEWITGAVIVIMLVLLLITAMCKAQDNTVSTGLKIGDQMPDITINNIINYPTQTAKISDFKGKLLILDFWATWCGSCINNLPKMELLQSKYSGKIKIVGVAYEKYQKIKDFFQTKKDRNGQTYYFPSITDDQIFAKLFPHQFIPHCAWINSEGKVVAITDAESVSDEHINTMLTTGDLQINLKRDLKPDKPLFLSEDAPLDSMISYSVLLKTNYSGLGSGQQKRMYKNIVRGCAMTNSSMLAIYENAIRPLFVERNDSYSSKRLILQFKNSSGVGLVRSKDSSSVIRNNYNYDFILPTRLSDSLYSFMLKDLNMVSGFAGKIQPRLIKCLALVLKDTSKRLKSTGGQRQNTLFYKKPAKLTNEPLNHLISRLNGLQQIPFLVVDETNFSGNVDLEFSGDYSLKTIREELNAFGLDLIEKTKMINMFILTEMENSNSQAESQKNPYKIIKP